MKIALRPVTGAPGAHSATPGAANAPWLVLLHGLAQDHRVFDMQIAAFANDHRILAVDLPGHGAAAGHAGSYDLTVMTDAVIAAMDRAGAHAATIWGTHTGASVALALAVSAPERVERLVLEGPVTPGAGLSVVAETFAQTRHALLKDGLDAARAVWWSAGCWYRLIKRDPDTRRAAEQRAILDGFGGAPWRAPPPQDAAAAIGARIDAITSPTLIYNGEFDDPEFADAASALAARLPNVVATQIPDTGGFPAWERPEAVNARVAAFLLGARH